jgi:hypothetical protein
VQAEPRRGCFANPSQDIWHTGFEVLECLLPLKAKIPQSHRFSNYQYNLGVIIFRSLSVSNYYKFICHLSFYGNFGLYDYQTHFFAPPPFSLNGLVRVCYLTYRHCDGKAGRPINEQMTYPGSGASASPRLYPELEKK